MSFCQIQSYMSRSSHPHELRVTQHIVQLIGHPVGAFILDLLLIEWLDDIYIEARGDRKKESQ